MIIMHSAVIIFLSYIDKNVESLFLLVFIPTAVISPRLQLRCSSPHTPQPLQRGNLTSMRRIMDDNRK